MAKISSSRVAEPVLAMVVSTRVTLVRKNDFSQE
jgi:hypothetical protein